ncbi:hypothetical protein U9R90_23875 [Streptomyces sp. E11-3]
MRKALLFKVVEPPQETFDRSRAIGARWDIAGADGIDAGIFTYKE